MVLQLSWMCDIMWMSVGHWENQKWYRLRYCVWVLQCVTLTTYSLNTVQIEWVSRTIKAVEDSRTRPVPSAFRSRGKSATNKQLTPTVQTRWLNQVGWLYQTVCVAHSLTWFETFVVACRNPRDTKGISESNHKRVRVIVLNLFCAHIWNCRFETPFALIEHFGNPKVDHADKVQRVANIKVPSIYKPEGRKLGEAFAMRQVEDEMHRVLAFEANHNENMMTNEMHHICCCCL